MIDCYASHLAGFRNWALGLCLATLMVPSTPAAGLVATKTLYYRQGDQELEGYLATPEIPPGQTRPAILLIHDWTGLQEYAKERTRQLAAELGYVALAADVYGRGIRPENPKECGVQAGLYRGDRALFRQRLLAALEVLKKQPGVDSDKLGAIGYCFGGTGVLELARSGAWVRGVVSFHGGLDSPNPDDGKNIKAKVLILHGASDPHVPQEGIAALVQELNTWKVDWQMISYGGAVHSFTKPAAGNDPSKGSAYNASADQRSWNHMKFFFRELFGD